MSSRLRWTSMFKETGALLTVQSMDGRLDLDISGWNVGQVTDMTRMFYGTSSFNQDLSKWNTSSVTAMNAMFDGASSFDGNISSWNTAAVTDMFQMFYGASSFNQDLLKLDISGFRFRPPTDPLWNMFSRWSQCSESFLLMIDVAKETAERMMVFEKSYMSSVSVGCVPDYLLQYLILLTQSVASRREQRYSGEPQVDIRSDCQRSEVGFGSRSRAGIVRFDLPYDELMHQNTQSPLSWTVV
eukprot:scaffold945_cov103-Skeletonema_dohrnii-CCMP3373.AAC.8